MYVLTTKQKILLRAKALAAATVDIPNTVIPLTGNKEKYRTVLRKVKALYR